jgi:hypothetical protein
MKVKELFEEEIKNTYGNVTLHPKDIKDGIIIHDYYNDTINGFFDCGDIGLKSLKHCPKIVKRGFYCGDNEITSLKYCPDEITDGNLMCYPGKISSLAGFGKEYCFKINGSLYLEKNPLSSNVLGLMKVKELKSIIIDNKEVEKIINKHLRSGKRISKCKEELIEAGLQEFAKL